MKTFTKFFAILLTNNLNSQNLETPWVLYPRSCNLNLEPPQVSILPGADPNYDVPYIDANAAFAPNGDLKFYLIDDALYDANGFKSGNVYNTKTLQQIIGGSIEVNPNPAADWTNFNYTLPDMDSKGEIIISDVSGNLVQKFTVSAMQGNQIWDTRNIKPGVYYYMFTIDGFSKNGKIVVTH